MFVMPDSVIPVSVMPVSSFTLYLIPHLNINVIPDSVMPESVISLSTFCYAKFPFPEKCYARFLFLVIPDSVIPVSVMPVSSFLLYLIPESEIHVIPDSVIPVSVISLSTFLLCLIPLYQVPLYSFPISKIIPDSVIPLSVIPKSVMPGSPPPAKPASCRPDLVMDLSLHNFSRLLRGHEVLAKISCKVIHFTTPSRNSKSLCQHKGLATYLGSSWTQLKPVAFFAEIFQTWTFSFPQPVSQVEGAWDCGTL